MPFTRTDGFTNGLGVGVGIEVGVGVGVGFGVGLDVGTGVAVGAAMQKSSNATIMFSNKMTRLRKNNSDRFSILFGIIFFDFLFF